MGRKDIDRTHKTSWNAYPKAEPKKVSLVNESSKIKKIFF